MTIGDHIEHQVTTMPRQSQRAARVLKTIHHMAAILEIVGQTATMASGR